MYSSLKLFKLLATCELKQVTQAKFWTIGSSILQCIVCLRPFDCSLPSIAFIFFPPLTWDFRIRIKWQNAACVVRQFDWDPFPFLGLKSSPSEALLLAVISDLVLSWIVSGASVGVTVAEASFLINLCNEYH